uniref:Uncharacterized protein n=1 Tax=Oryza brachyantha TaxID=4533 RepID=J3L1W1_ORYBR
MATARHLNTTAVTASKVEQASPVEALKSSLMRAMLSGEISTTWVTKLNAVNDGGGPRGGGLGGSGIASRSHTGATDGAGAPRAISPAAFRNCAAPCPSNTRWLKQIPTAKPPQVNFVTCKAKDLKPLAPKNFSR